jgi:hypothetical protein
MPKSFVHTLTLSLSILAAGAVLKYSPSVDAIGTTRVTKDVTFRTTIPHGDTSAHVLGVVPAGTRLYIRDLYSNGPNAIGTVDVVEVLADGVVIFNAEIGVAGSEANRPFTMSVGVPIEAGKTLSVRRQQRFSTTTDMDLLVGATSAVL